MQKFLGFLAVAIGGIAIFIGAILFFAILNGFVLSWLWLWFLVPLGLPAVGVIHSIGIAGTVGFLAKQRTKTDDEAPGTAFLYGLLTPAIALGFGWVIHAFM